MKRLFFVIMALVLSLSATTAQSVSYARVLADEQMRDFVWAVGEGKSLEEADKSALNALTTLDVTIVNLTKSKIKDVGTATSASSEERFEQMSATISNLYLENVRREILPDKGGMKRVLRYMTRVDWEARYTNLKGSIEEYIKAGRYAPNVEDRIRNYVWAFVLLQSYPQNDIEIEGRPAKAWLPEQVNAILHEVDVRVVAIEQDKKNKLYPYKLFIDVMYGKEEPVGYLGFSYNDGEAVVDGETVKDGRGVVQMKRLPEQLEIHIDILSRELARQLDPTVYVLLGNDAALKSLNAAYKRVETRPSGMRPKKEVNTSVVASPVKDSHAKVESKYVPTQSTLSTTSPYTEIMTDIVGSIEKLSSDNIRHHFTDEAWQHYCKIVASGHPTIARTPEYRFTQHDTLVLCHAVPLKLEFSGNRKFIEDVVFRVNSRTHKVESVAYKLASSVEKKIMSMAWDDAARLTLISFLEDYRTAYSLRDLEYIDKVFAEDAYIIVGRVLQRSTRNYGDTPYKLATGNAVYSRQSKREYVNNLRRSFDAKEFVNLRFEDCRVAKGFYAKEGIYAVQLRQLYFSNNYADDGVLTLAIDMRRETNPLVRVRVWQQERDVNYTAEEMIEQTVSTTDAVEP